jgi:hypothetical protein
MRPVPSRTVQMSAASEPVRPSTAGGVHPQSCRLAPALAPWLMTVSLERGADQLNPTVAAVAADAGRG